MIDRDLAAQARTVAKKLPVIAVTGPRQSGKTTFARATFPDHAYVSLESPSERRAAETDAGGFLARFPGGAILDEVQRVGELTSYLQGIVDEDRRPGRWILTGSQHFALSRSLSQSLAGRVALLELFPPGWSELQRFPKPPASLDDALFAGAFPRIHDQAIDPTQWLGSYVGTYIDRDVRDVLDITDRRTFHNFLGQAAGRAGQLVNLSGLGADCGVSHHTVRSWLSVLETSYAAFFVSPLVRSLRRRLIKAPKLYFYDTGLLCYLLGIESPAHLARHPLRGSVFEAWVISEVVKAHAHRGKRLRMSFYRDQRTEVDLILEREDRMVAVEIKSGMTVVDDFFRGLAQFERALADDPHPPKLSKVIVYGGDGSHRRSGVHLVSWRDVAEFDWGSL